MGVTDIIVPDEVQNVDGHVFNEVLAILNI